MSNFLTRLNKAIPGGAHTYSRGHDQFPENAPNLLVRGKGAYVYDIEDNEYLDFGMGLRSVTVGYGDERIAQAAQKQILYGNNLTKPSLVELEAAELLIDLIESVDMVKFCKNGSSAVSAAVKLARAYTGREKVLCCRQHPFFSYDDWFIGSTPIKRGIPQETYKQTLHFDYNDLDSLERAQAENPGTIACVVMEPATTEAPAGSKEVAGENFLHDVKRFCEKHGIVFILDEMITGFRWHLKGAQHYYDIRPDLCTFGKAMANGFSVAAVAGKREIMELGSIEKEGQERLFLMSSTHGAEMSSLGAFIETISVLKEKNVIDHLWKVGQEVIDHFNRAAKKHGIQEFVKAYAEASCNPTYVILNKANQPDMPLRTLFLQEMMRQKVFFTYISLSYAHQEKEMQQVGNALDQAMQVLAKAYDQGVGELLRGNAVKPVFRQFN